MATVLEQTRTDAPRLTAKAGMERKFSLRYLAGLSLVGLSRLMRGVVSRAIRIAALPERFAVIIWTQPEIDRHANADWNRWNHVRIYSRLEGWTDATEKSLIEDHFEGSGQVLNMACGAGREATLMARLGLRVTGCDWSPRMIEAARMRADKDGLPIRYDVAGMYDLPYTEGSFDYALVPNIAFSYVFPRRRRLEFLRRVHSILRPGGTLILSFVPQRSGRWGRLDSLLARLSRYRPFNTEYEPGDRIQSQLTHLFDEESLKSEVGETELTIKQWVWEDGYVVLSKAEQPTGDR